MPEKPYQYVVNGKSAIEWILDRYQVKTDKDSGIKNDPNLYAEESNQPDYILNLLLSVIAVSVRTVEIVEGLPELSLDGADLDIENYEEIDNQNGDNEATPKNSEAIMRPLDGTRADYTELTLEDIEDDELLSEFVPMLKTTQSELKYMVVARLESVGYSVENRDGFLYAAGDLPVMLLAHLDTVHQVPESIGRTYGGKRLTSPTGIGGDDRCGVYMILQIVKSGLRPHLLFCEDEEKRNNKDGSPGGGARLFVQSGIKPDVNYLIEIDRKGHNDAVYYKCCNPQFEEFISAFRFKTKGGSYTDICEVAPYLKVAAVNLSAAFYDSHNVNESIDPTEMLCNIKRVSRIITKDTKKFKWME